MTKLEAHVDAQNKSITVLTLLGKSVATSIGSWKETAAAMAKHLEQEAANVRMENEKARKIQEKAKKAADKKAQAEAKKAAKALEKKGKKKGGKGSQGDQAENPGSVAWAGVAFALRLRLG